MSGVAIIIKKADFSMLGNGVVSRYGEAPVDVPVELVNKGLIHNYDAFGAQTTTLYNTCDAQQAITVNGIVGDNSIIVTQASPAVAAYGTAAESALDGKSLWTLEFVLKAAGWSSSSENTLFHDITSYELDGRMQISLGRIGNNINGAVFMRYNRTWRAMLFDASTLNIDWSVPHTIHITREEVDKTGMMFYLYIDGERFATASGAEASTIQNKGQSANFIETTGARDFYALRIYDRPLTPSEVANNHQYNVERYNF